jgi:hypothetical protein
VTKTVGILLLSSWFFGSRRVFAESGASHEPADRQADEPETVKNIGAGSLDSPPSSDSPVRRTLNFLRSHPILCLFFLTPEIPEYITGSSAVSAILLNPGTFAFQIAANAALYLPGALLIREAMIRWKKGWASVLLLGAAYGILEEGIALSTLFNPNAGPVGDFGYYGHWLGVNWVWVAGIVPVHMIFSISLPILLLGLALPHTWGKSLLSSRRSIALTFLILSVDVCILSLVIFFWEHFWMGWPIFFASMAVISLLVFLARRAPADLIRSKTENPKLSPLATGFFGATFYPSVLLTEFVGKGAKLPASITTILVVAVQSVYLIYMLRVLGQKSNERQLITFALGLIIPLVVFGVVSQIRLPLVLLVDVIVFLFFRKMWQKYGDGSLHVLQVPSEMPVS